ncbi:MAG: IS3 family transposase, partial [Lactobacillaceae bacterium]|nr:IS3 family transposase [Lactobacillaceae bacterium]
MANETTTQEKFQLIQTVTAHDNNELSIELLCELAGVSRSGYYNWRKREPIRQTREERDRVEFEKILAAYQFRGYAKGSRSIHMRLLHQGIRMNRKKISRLMRKFNLFCPIRKPNPYKRIAKANAENSVKKNILNREFEEHGARQVLLTDITYLFYG